VTECPTCHNQVPEGTYCVVCGSHLGEGAGKMRKEFSAAPGQNVMRPAPMSTIFPQLPNDEMRNFYTALEIGVVVMVVLAVFGFFPLALVAAAVLMPIITVVYVYDVDVYEDEPIRIIGLTMLAGAVAGVAAGILARGLAPIDAASLMEPSRTDAFIRIVVLPIVGIALTMIGPIFLLRYKRFNDVLDGATFGVAAAVSFAGASLIVSSWPYFQAGLRPGGAVLGWIVRLLNLGILLPLLYAGAMGIVGGALWLRYRAPVRDRDALGPLGKPPVAIFVAALALILGALALEVIPEWAALIVLLLLDAAVIIGLRVVIHLGLMQEAAEREIGGPITCPNCRHETALHTFCSNCGISLQALPKAGEASVDRRATT
jgi:ribosomal protein L32